MGDPEAKSYYVLTLQGQQGPFDKQGLKDLVLAGGARPEDQVRTAFGRPLGTVREVVGPIRQTGSGRVAADRPATGSGRRPATGSATGRSPATASAVARSHARPHQSGRAAATASARAARGSGRGAAPARGTGRWLWLLLAAILLAIAGLAAALLGRG